MLTMSRLLFAAFLLIAAPSAAAGDPPPWDVAAFTAAPADLLAAASPADEEEEGEDVRVLLREREHSFDAEGRGTVASTSWSPSWPRTGSTAGRPGR